MFCPVMAMEEQVLTLEKYACSPDSCESYLLFLPKFFLVFKFLCFSTRLFFELGKLLKGLLLYGNRQNVSFDFFNFFENIHLPPNSFVDQ